MNKKKKGFTLIELIIVIAIISILAAIAIPRYNKSKLKAAYTADEANRQVLTTAAEMAIADGNIDSFPWTEGSPSNNEYIEKWPEIPKGLDHDEDGYTVKYENGVINIEPVITQKAQD
ncbi:prepilin-type N-terminal cleavage/methylation domain-containing protein [Anaerococcus prevotii]|uniref:Prepilin-type cleavage/methylation N-terminal domain protein n=1 Tax=Anaerococcus prevotii ACS-065-V-Col13 TaxID=879305 RepID=F0GWK7_9FIRM|nr:prepilin-type N-terminal cleavage/methylation domain-containing protein [Anaerococcus prevotii]EGC81805.1 prepilin-type cleavage/methylation N-terminal domain protein [Anaerococcus prevotii ACS-065-V-Col13]